MTIHIFDYITRKMQSIFFFRAGDTFLHIPNVYDTN